MNTEYINDKVWCIEALDPMTTNFHWNCTLKYQEIYSEGGRFYKVPLKGKEMLGSWIFGYGKTKTYIVLINDVNTVTLSNNA